MNVLCRSIALLALLSLPLSATYADNGASLKLPTLLDNPVLGEEKEPSAASLKVPEGLASLNDEDLWARVRSGFRIPAVDNSRTQEHEEWYASRATYLNRMLERSRRYLFYIVNEVDKRGMPMEIALLPMIESAFNPQAYSRAHASGIWQFMPATGKHFGLEQTAWYDGRRDILAATKAALDYLQYLHRMFGDWQLALAAYNWGEGSVSRAIAKNRARNLPTDYAHLSMPAETRQYVPKLLAIRNILKDPSRYSIRLSAIPNQPYFITLNPEQHMDLKVAAQLAEMPVEEFLNLNPAFKKPVLAHKPARKLVLPVEKAETFAENLANYDQPLMSWAPYQTKMGESLEDIASRHETSLAALQSMNDLPTRQRTAQGQVLLVPRRATQQTGIGLTLSGKRL